MTYNAYSICRLRTPSLFINAIFEADEYSIGPAGAANLDEENMGTPLTNCFYLILFKQYGPIRNISLAMSTLFVYV